MTFIVRGADKTQRGDVMCVELRVTSGWWVTYTGGTGVTQAARTLVERAGLLLSLLGWLVR